MNIYACITFTDQSLVFMIHSNYKYFCLIQFGVGLLIGCMTKYLSDSVCPDMLYTYDRITLWTIILWDARNSQQLFRVETFGTLLLYFGTRTCLFSPDEGSCYVFSTRDNCCEFFAAYDAVILSAILSNTSL